MMKNFFKKYPHILHKEDVENLSAYKLFDHVIDYYQSILFSMPGNVYWLDKNCIGVGCNANVLSMFGLKSLDEFKGLSFEDMGRIGDWSPEATQKFQTDSEEVIKTGQPKLNVEEPPIPHKNGSLIYFLTSRVPLFNHHGETIGIVGISIDISELKRTQNALKEAKDEAESATKARSDFIANMSHDVKTPLSGIIGLTQLLTESVAQKDKETTQTILSSSKQLLYFFENCIEVFNLETKSVAYPLAQFNLKELIVEIEELFQPAISIKNIELNIHYNDQIPEYILGNRAGVFRMLLNLVGNAVKFTHTGFITIHITSIKSLSANQIIIQFIIEDTGIGIPKDKQKIIFEQFSRLTPSYKGTYEGTGIGLYLVQKFVTSTHGKISVESELDKGSRFIVTLPFEIPPTKEKTRKTKTLEERYLANTTIDSKEITETLANLKKPLNILLVEDNEIVLKMQTALLSSIKCNIFTATSGEKVLEMFQPGKFDLLLLDLGLPGIQGEQVAAEIRKHEQATEWHLPIIALTAHLGDKKTKEVMLAGINKVFIKPLLREQIENIIYQICVKDN